MKIGTCILKGLILGTIHIVINLIIYDFQALIIGTKRQHFLFSLMGNHMKLYNTIGPKPLALLCTPTQENRHESRTMLFVRYQAKPFNKHIHIVFYLLMAVCNYNICGEP